MTLVELAKQTAGLGDWWDKVDRIHVTPEFTPCLVCDYHPMSEVNAGRLNQLLNRVRELGGGSPVCYWVHCDSTVFVEWFNPSGEAKRVLLDWESDKQAEIMVSRMDHSEEPHKHCCEFYQLVAE
jgi:hypothetical protein